MNILVVGIIVFALTLILTKSKILAGKREFVKLRYESSKVNNQQPDWIHRWWAAMWLCPMCSGFWVALVVCFFFPSYNIVADVLFCFGFNWLIHCLEDVLFHSGKILEKLLDNEEEKV